MNKEEIDKHDPHPLAMLFPALDDRQQQELENSIKQIGLQEEITLYNGQILDGIHRDRACRNVGVKPRYKNLPDNISPENYVLAKNIHRRHLNPAEKVEIALKLREKREDQLINEKKIIEKLERENKNDILIQNALMVRERREDEKVAKIVGTKPESIRQAIVIRNKSKQDPKIAAEWQNALSGKTTIEAVYKKVTQAKEPKNNRGNRKKDTLIENNATEQKNILMEKLANLSHINQLIREKFDRLVHALKETLIDVKKAPGDIENKFKQLIEKVENIIVEINNPSRETLFYTPPADLRKAELKLN